VRVSAPPRPCAFLLLGFALLCPMLGRASAGSAAWLTRSWQSDDGLPTNHVTGVTALRDGFLWVATYAALARFDGHAFQEFSPASLGIGSNQKLSALAPAANGALWVGTIHGNVLWLDGQRVESIRGFPYKPITSLLDAGPAGLWIIHQGGTVHRWRDGRVTPFGPREGLPAPDAPDRYVCQLARDRDGQLWFVKDGHVGVFRDEHFVTRVQLEPLNAAITRAMRGGVWVASNGRLLHIDSNGTVQPLGTFPSKPGTDPTVLLEDRHGNVWVGTSNQGLFHCENGRIQLVDTPDHRITALAEDAEGSIWAGTVGGGLHRVRRRVVTLEAPAAGIVQSLAEDSSGAIWATTQSGQLLRRRGDDAWETLSTAPHWPGGRAATVAADASGAVWIGTRDRMLHRWRDGAFSTWRRVNGLAGREIHALLVARNGDVWLGLSSPDIVQRWRNGKFDTYAMPEGIRVIRAIAEDADGAIWIGSSRGLLVRILDGIVSDETGRTNGAPRSIRTLRATEDGALWIGYADEGLGWLKGSRFAHLAPARGFPEPAVSQVVPDTRGSLWLAGDHGVFRVSGDALAAFARAVAPMPHFSRFGRSEGLFSVEANFGDAPGALRGRDGRVWLPMRNGLAIIDPTQVRSDLPPPPVHLTRVLVDDRVVAASTYPVPSPAADTTRGELPPSHRRVVFDYAAPSFHAPENIRFRYQLEGFDESWVDAGMQRTAVYSRLPYGRYRFRVQASNHEGVWSDQSATLALAVAPFVWQTWWFHFAWATVLVGATIGVVRIVSLRRVRARLRELEQQAALQRERTRIARDLHDDFGTRLTELGLLAELSGHGTPTGESPPHRELLERIRGLERDLDTIVWAVNPRNDTLDHLVGFTCRVSGEYLARAGLRCRLALPDDIPARSISPELRHHLFLVVREAVHNVVKHARASEAMLRVCLEDDTLVWSIADNGRGCRAPHAEHRNGLRNMRARLAELGGTFALETHDNRGTTVTLRVPLVARSTGRASSSSTGDDSLSVLGQKIPLPLSPP
jgi:ligand-binding sensor domain-containing protein/signal transduction histidine kinase